MTHSRHEPRSPRIPTTRATPIPMARIWNAMAIMWACRSANRKLKYGNSVMLIVGGSMRLGRQKSNSRRSAPWTTTCQAPPTLFTTLSTIGRFESSCQELTSDKRSTS